MIKGVSLTKIPLLIVVSDRVLLLASSGPPLVDGGIGP